VVEAYSYLRFSTPKQEWGDSERRQKAARDKWLRDHPDVHFNTAFDDKGVSGSTGANREEGSGLAEFLTLVEGGQVPAGSYLIVEYLDRLTREPLKRALPLVMDLIDAGVRIVDLSSGRVLDDGMDDGAQLAMVVQLWQSNVENTKRTERMREAKAEVRRRAREEGKPHGSRCPEWLMLVGDRYEVKPGAKRTFGLIYRWCVEEGMGATAILQRLIREGVPHFGGGRWSRSYVVKLLSSRTVVGEYQSTRGHGRREKEGDARPGYYPPVVLEATYDRAQRAKRSRRGRTGRAPKNGLNLFSGMVWSALDGCKYRYETNRGKKQLIPAKAVDGDRSARWRSFPADVFEDAILTELKEVRGSDVFPPPDSAKSAGIAAEIAAVKARLAVASDRFKKNPGSEKWPDLIDECEKAIRDLEKDQRKAEEEEHDPQSVRWDETTSLIGLKAVYPGRLHAALKRTIRAIHCVVVPRGDSNERVAIVQVHFLGGIGFRGYRIHYRSSKGGAVKREQSWTVASCHLDAVPGLPGPVADLSDPNCARLIEAVERHFPPDKHTPMIGSRIDE
jgi:hypothetical protein